MRTLIGARDGTRGGAWGLLTSAATLITKSHGPGTELIQIKLRVRCGCSKSHVPIDLECPAPEDALAAGLFLVGSPVTAGSGTSMLVPSTGRYGTKQNLQRKFHMYRKSFVVSAAASLLIRPSLCPWVAARSRCLGVMAR
jgi:hypothetical protein